MKRRSFLKTLGLGTSLLYLRFAPTSYKAVPKVDETPTPITTEGEIGLLNEDWVFDVLDVGQRKIGKFVKTTEHNWSYLEYDA